MNEAQLHRSLRWSKAPVNAACRFAIRGPDWLPGAVRRVPLRILATVVEVQVLWLTRGNGVSGS